MESFCLRFNRSVNTIKKEINTECEIIQRRMAFSIDFGFGVLFLAINLLRGGGSISNQ